MSNLFNLGRRGLSAAQMGLNVTGHNITNVNTPGFSRQQALVSTTNAQGTSAGWVGTGLQTDSVRRIYDGFLTGQVNSTTANQASTSTFTNQMSRVNNLIADRTVGVAPALSEFFEGVNAVASQPAEPAARQELLGRAESLASQITNTNRFLQDQREGMNQQIETTVRQVNSMAARVNELNQQIQSARATVYGQPPNDLLDQRDQLVTDLNELVGVTVVEQGDRFNLTVGNGQTLVSGNRVYDLQAVRSDADPTRMAVAYTTAGGASVELADDVIQGGQLGGLLQYRTEVLDQTQNELGRLALSMGLAFNAQHTQGGTLSGQAGGDFFDLGTLPRQAISSQRNADPSGVTLNYGFTANAASELTLSDYQVEFSGGEYTVQRLSDGVEFQPTPAGDLDGFELDGLVFDAPGGTPTDGDTFLVQPTRQAARDFGVAITNPSDIAASVHDPADATVGGSANGDNALAMAQLQTRKILGGNTMSATEAFSQLVNNVGVKAQSANTQLSAQTTLKQQAFQAQQGVSGVNLNEEYINLDFYTQQYNASARIIDVGTTLFDTLLGLGR